MLNLDEEENSSQMVHKFVGYIHARVNNADSEKTNYNAHSHYHEARWNDWSLHCGIIELVKSRREILTLSIVCQLCMIVSMSALFYSYLIILPQWFWSQYFTRFIQHM